MIDKSKLEKYPAALFEELIRRHPEWLDYSELILSGPKDTEWLKWDKSYVKYVGFIISIPCSVIGNPPLEIIFADYPEVGFGGALVEFYPNEPPPEAIEMADEVEEFIHQIINEEIIVTEYPNRKWNWWRKFFGANFRFVPKEYYKEHYKILIRRGALRSVVSWKGTFNYNYDGEWEKDS